MDRWSHSGYWSFSIVTFLLLLAWMPSTTASTLRLSNPGGFLQYLSISNNNITGRIPERLCDSAELTLLDLSNNSLVGSIPYCLTNSSLLSVLNLGKNQLNGSIPDGFPSDCNLKSLHLNDNRISGRVPSSLSRCRNLEVLDLSNNELTGEFPSWLGSLSELRVLSLHSNQFYGSVVPSPYENQFPKLQIMDVSSNNLSGILQPGLFRILSGMMEKKSNMVGEFFTDSYYVDSVTVTFKGKEFHMDRTLYLLTSIDMSNNHLSGEIPTEIGIIKGLVILNMSKNDLVGPIPPSLANLVQLQSLDLSCNRLSGNIPVAFPRLTFLAALNLSFNNLQGQIPQANQLSTFEASSFEGNPGLCGPPLIHACTYADAVPPNITNGNTKIDVSSFIATELGFIVGLASVVMPIFLVRRVRMWILWSDV